MRLSSALQACLRLYLQLVLGLLAGIQRIQRLCSVTHKPPCSTSAALGRAPEPAKYVGIVFAEDKAQAATFERVAEDVLRW
jgi:hypothetical protein